MYKTSYKLNIALLQPCGKTCCVGCNPAPSEVLGRRGTENRKERVQHHFRHGRAALRHALYERDDVVDDGRYRSKVRGSVREVDRTEAERTRADQAGGCAEMMAVLVRGRALSRLCEHNTPLSSFWIVQSLPCRWRAIQTSFIGCDEAEVVATN
jgi:hypothetical protein